LRQLSNSQNKRRTHQISGGFFFFSLHRYFFSPPAPEELWLERVLELLSPLAPEERSLERVLEFLTPLAPEERRLERVLEFLTPLAPEELWLERVLEFLTPLAPEERRGEGPGVRGNLPATDTINIRDGHQKLTVEMDGEERSTDERPVQD
jgi:hypothetical protein